MYNTKSPNNNFFGYRQAPTYDFFLKTPEKVAFD